MWLTAARSRMICTPDFQVMSKKPLTIVLAKSVMTCGSPRTSVNASKAGKLNIYACCCSEVADPVIITWVRSMVMTTPDAMITGKKNTARQNVRPTNFCRRIMAMNRLNTTMTGTW